MKKMLESLLSQLGGCKNELPSAIGASAEGVIVYPRSFHRIGEQKALKAPKQ